MSRGHIYTSEYRPQFSGHETFPLRYGWLKKAYDLVSDSRHDPRNKSLFLDDGAIATLGVGKNMVSSIRFWAQACNIIEESGANGLVPTQLGDEIFDAGGLDPYMENAATLWLIHWHLCSTPERTTWYWAFNHFLAQSFERELLVKDLLRLASTREWPRVSATTVKRDVECFVRTYAARMPSDRRLHEEALESPLAELGLLKATAKKDGFRFVKGEQAALGEGVFAYATAKFWEGFSPSSKSLSFEAIAHEPGSPGRVFCLEEQELARRLAEIEDYTDGAMLWSETAGLKQLSRRHHFEAAEVQSFLMRDYGRASLRRAA